MAKQIIDCKGIKNEILNMQKEIIEENNLQPKLLILSVGQDEASQKYVNNKIKACESVGIVCHLKNFGSDCTEEDLEVEICDANKKYNSIIVQEPLPKHINGGLLNNLIRPELDCDGTSFANLGLLTKKQTLCIPATPQGIIKMLLMETQLAGAEVLIVGRSLLVGQPLSIALTHLDATVTLAHSKTKDLQEKLSSGRYDIIISAIGQPKVIKNAKAKVLVDVGINFVDGKMCGDIDIDGCECEKYTSVPNGVGQLTVASVVENVVKLTMFQKGDK